MYEKSSKLYLLFVVGKSGEIKNKEVPPIQKLTGFSAWKRLPVASGQKT